MSSIDSLNKRVDVMLENIRKRVDPPVPAYGLIVYQPIAAVERGVQKMSKGEYHARILQEQPAVRARFEELRNKGCHVWIWLPA